MMQNRPSALKFGSLSNSTDDLVTLFSPTPAPPPRPPTAGVLWCARNSLEARSSIEAYEMSSVNSFRGAEQPAFHGEEQPVFDEGAFSRLSLVADGVLDQRPTKMIASVNVGQSTPQEPPKKKTCMKQRSSINRKEGTARQRAVKGSNYCMNYGDKTELLKGVSLITTNGTAKKENKGIMHIAKQFGLPARTLRRNGEIARGTIQYQQGRGSAFHFDDISKAPWTVSAYFPSYPGPFEKPLYPGLFRQDCARQAKMTLTADLDKGVVELEKYEKSLRGTHRATVSEQLLKLVRKRFSDWSKSFAECPSPVTPSVYESSVAAITMWAAKDFPQFYVKKRKARRKAEITKLAKEHSFTKQMIKDEQMKHRPTEAEVKKWQAEAANFVTQWQRQLGITGNVEPAPTIPAFKAKEEHGIVDEEEARCKAMEIRRETAKHRRRWTYVVDRQLNKLKTLVKPLCPDFEANFEQTLAEARQKATEKKNKEKRKRKASELL